MSGPKKYVGLSEDHIGGVDRGGACQAKQQQQNPPNPQILLCVGGEAGKSKVVQ